MTQNNMQIRGKVKGTNRFTYHKGPMHTAAAQVGGVLGEVDGPEPLHDTVVSPQHDLPWLVLHWLVQLKQKYLHLASGYLM